MSTRQPKLFGGGCCTGTGTGKREGGTDGAQKNRQTVARLLTPSESLAVSGSEPLTLEISNLLRLLPLKGVGGVGGDELVSTSSKQKAGLI